MEKQYRDDNDEIEIDIKELFYAFKKKLWLILAALVIGAGSVGAFSAFVMVPQYRSEAKLYVLSKETTLTSLADLQIGSQLTQDYKVLVTSRPVLQGVVDHLGLNLTYKELAKKLKIDNPTGTRILSLSIEDPNPYIAKAIVDDIASTASDYIGEIMEMIPPKLIEDGEVATEKVSPSTKRNAAIGGLAAVLLVCGLITLRVVMNDTVKTEEDVRKFLDLPVLAVVPKKKDKKDETKKGQNQKKHEYKTSERSRKAGRGDVSAGDSTAPREGVVSRESVAPREKSVSLEGAAPREKSVSRESTVSREKAVSRESAAGREHVSRRRNAPDTIHKKEDTPNE